MSDSDKNGGMDESDKNEGMNKPDCGDEPSVSKSIAKLIEAFIGTYFQLLKTPLPLSTRFFYAWLGSATMFATSPLISPVVVRFLSGDTPLLPDSMLAIGNMYVSFIFAFVIASAKTKHGPVRLFLFGLMLTAFVITLTNGVWAK